MNYESGKSTIGDREGKPFKKLSPVPLRVVSTEPDGISDAALYRVVKKMKLGTKTERQEDGSTRKVFNGSLEYNKYLTIMGIPLESFNYVVNGRSPLEWLVERYYCKEDKASGIVDDPNEWSSNPRYIFDLVPRLVAVSLRTLELTSQLPDLE